MSLNVRKVGIFDQGVYHFIRAIIHDTYSPAQVLQLLVNNVHRVKSIVAYDIENIFDKSRNFNVHKPFCLKPKGQIIQFVFHLFYHPKNPSF